MIVISRSSGLRVGEISRLRKEICEAKSSIKVLKNTVARVVVENSDFACLSDCFSGQTAVAYTNNPIEMAKVLFNFAKDSEKITILGGVVDGKFLSPAAVAVLATLPSLDELRGKLVGLLVCVAGNIARVIKEPSARIARVLAARD
jgi:large subunit ribosomal protein L10